MTLPVRSRPRAVAGWDPFRELDELTQRVNSLWEANLNGDLHSWAPLADVEETDDAYVVDIELPGVRRDDVAIEVLDGRLSVTGERRERQRVGLLRRTTRTTGRFRLHVALPLEIDADAVTADLDHGLLTVTVPKAARARRRRIPIGRPQH